MVGRPQKRLRQLTTQLEANGIDPATLGSKPAPTKTVGVEDLAPDTTHARTHARTRANPTPPIASRPAHVGPATRNESDRRNAHDLSELADKLLTGMSLRLERTRPTWAAGWVEDVMIDDHDLASVIDYIAQEHGGQMYRATVIGNDGSALYTSRIPIAGQPRSRGVVQPRSFWDGSEPPEARHVNYQPQIQQAPALDIKAIVDLVGTIVGQINGQGRERQDALVESVREMNAQNQKTTTTMLNTILHQREQERSGGGLREQLRDLVNAKQAIQEVQEVFGVSDRAAPRDEQPEEDMMQAVMKEAAVGIIRQGLANDAQRAPAQQQQPRQPPPGFRRVQPQPQPTQQTNGHAQPQQQRPPQQQQPKAQQ